MTDTSIIELYFRRSERAINESQASYGGYCYRVADGILRDARDSEESVNMACGVERHPSDAPELPQGLFRCADTPHLRRPAAPPLRRKARRGRGAHRA